MRRTKTIIGAIAIAALALASALALMAPPPPTAAGPLDGARTPAPDPNSDAELRKWIVGGWAEVSTQCRTDDGEYFAADGRYGNFSQHGHWNIAGSQLKLRVTHEFSDDLESGPDQGAAPLHSPANYSAKLKRDGQDRMTIILDGRSIAFMRCPEAQYSFGSGDE